MRIKYKIESAKGNLGLWIPVRGSRIFVLQRRSQDKTFGGISRHRLDDVGVAAFRGDDLELPMAEFFVGSAVVQGDGVVNGNSELRTGLGIFGEIFPVFEIARCEASVVLLFSGRDESDVFPRARDFLVVDVGRFEFVPFGNDHGDLCRFRFGDGSEQFGHAYRRKDADDDDDDDDNHDFNEGEAFFHGDFLSALENVRLRSKIGKFSRKIVFDWNPGIFVFEIRAGIIYAIFKISCMGFL